MPRDTTKHLSTVELLLTCLRQDFAADAASPFPAAVELAHADSHELEDGVTARMAEYKLAEKDKFRGAKIAAAGSLTGGLVWWTIPYVRQKLDKCTSLGIRCTLVSAPAVCVPEDRLQQKS